MMIKNKILLKLILLLFCVDANAMAEIELDCKDKGMVTIFHTNYRISTMKNSDDFYVSPGVNRKTIKGIQYNIYQFLSGDTYINNGYSHVMIFNDGEKIECKKTRTKNVHITNLSIAK